MKKYRIGYTEKGNDSPTFYSAQAHETRDGAILELLQLAGRPYHSHIVEDRYGTRYVGKVQTQYKEAMKC